MPELKSISGVEVFAAGKWNGDTYTVSDLDTMVEAFAETGGTFRPPLKLGHDPEQTLLQRDGHPAAGWVGRLYRSGEKLLADFIDIPQKIYDLLVSGAYKKVSAEIYWNARVGEKSYRRLLSAIALLGADLPAVSTLNDIFQMYRGEGDAKSYDLKGNRFMISSDPSPLKPHSKSEGKSMAEEKKDEVDYKAKCEEMSAKLKGLMDELEKEKAKNKKDNTVVPDPKQEQEIKRLSNELEAVNKKLKETETEKELDAMVAQKEITPAMKPFVRALFGEELKSYSLEIGEEKKEFSKQELVREILKLHKAAASVNVEESSETGERRTQDETAQDAKIKEYAEKNKVGYSAAYRAVMKTA